MAKVAEKTSYDIRRNQEDLNAVEERINQAKKIVEWEFIKTSTLSEKYRVIPFVPKNLHLEDSNNLNKSQIIQRADEVNQIGVNGLPGGVLAKNQVIQDRWFNATHPQSQVPESEKKNGIDNYNSLNKLISVFLGTTIERTINGEATLFGFPTGQSNLSDGQKVLLQFCLAIYSQGVALKDLILVMDEPENHLHPSVIIETLDRITACVPDGQIWIATHSIPLLSHYDPSQIWFVENGIVSHAGKVPEKVLHSLLGDDDEISKLQDFLSLPAQYASSRYAFESLIEPKTLNTDSNDPQSIQLRQNLLKLSSTGKIRVLDFGAGKGRIISNLFDLDETSKEQLVRQLDYIAYDYENKDKEHCEAAIVKAFGTSSDKYFNDLEKILSIYDRESFHVVIMCNVLHEIDPKNWLKLFSTEGDIPRLLSNNGILLLVEDQLIPTGEKAYQKGFLVLDTPQLKDLFKIKEADKGFEVTDARGDGRLKSHSIPKEYLVRIDETSRVEAIKSVSKMARTRTMEIRNQEKSYKNGRLHGFWVQQFANAQLNLDELTAK